MFAFGCHLPLKSCTSHSLPPPLQSATDNSCKRLLLPAVSSIVCLPLYTAAACIHNSRPSKPVIEMRRVISKDLGDRQRRAEEQEEATMSGLEKFIITSFKSEVQRDLQRRQDNPDLPWGPSYQQASSEVLCTYSKGAVLKYCVSFQAAA